MKILVSACLLGINCRYNGECRTDEKVIEKLKGHEIVPFCPEIYGGLSTPRDPAERKNGGVFTADGKDVTAQYTRGAREAVKTAQILGCDMAVLQDRSPMCGCGYIHNGLFDGGMVEGDGVATEELKKAGIKVIPASKF